jgi:hypothetical protein
MLTAASEEVLRVIRAARAGILPDGLSPEDGQALLRLAQTKPFGSNGGGAAAASSTASAELRQETTKPVASASAIPQPVASSVASKLDLLPFGGAAHELVAAFQARWPTAFRSPAPGEFTPLAHHSLEVLEREAPAQEFLEECFIDFKSSVSLPPSASASSSSSSAAGAPAPATTAAPSVTLDRQRRRFLAAHAAPGGGKSRFLEVLCSLCGPRSAPKVTAAAAPATTAVADSLLSMSQRVWKSFDTKFAAESRFQAFTQNMQQRLSITITFNDFQNGGTHGLTRSCALALRVIHRFV